MMQITASPPGDCDANGSRSVTLDASVSGGPAQYYIWNFGDGTPNVSIMAPSPPGPLNHSYQNTGTTAITPTVTLTATSLGGACAANATKQLNIPGCGGAPPPPPPPPSPGCGISVILIGALAALVLGAVIIGAVVMFCLHLPLPPWYWTVVAAAAAVIGLVILISYILCWIGWCPCFTKCDWLQIAYIAALAAAVIALYFAACCGLVWWLVSAALFASAGLAFKEWVNHCSPTTCQKVLSTVVALATVAGTLFGFIALLGPLTAALTACAGTFGAAVKWGAAAVAAILTGWATVHCTQQGP
jgi:hypothetical protein